MKYSIAALLIIVLASSIFTFTPNIAVYATHSALAIDGAITIPSCGEVSGTIVTETIDMQHTQSVGLCKFAGKYYRIVDNRSCFEEQVGLGKNPYTGKVHTFGYICDVPRTCDPPNSWGEHHRFRIDYYESKLHINAGDKQFDIITGSKGIVCTFESFNQQEKNVSIVAKGIQGTKSSIDVTIPSELLSGEFNVLVDGNDAEYKIEMTETTSKITIALYFPQGESTISIMGTQVIPEFSIVSLIIFATGISYIVATKLMSKISRKKEIIR